MKNLQLSKYSLLLALAGLISFSVFSQETFNYQADIEYISKTGFYKIKLQPELVAKSNGNLSDIRIIDNKQNFVPYAKLKSVSSVKENFVGFPLIENSENNDTTTTLIVENKNRLLIRSLWLRLKNTAVSRSVDLVGSDDMKKWFAIDENITIQQSYSTNTDAYYQSLSFPASNYQFLKVTIHNKNKSPIKVLETGIFSKNSLVPQFLLISKPTIVRKDSIDKNTYLYLTFKDNYLINKLIIPVGSPKYFSRKVMVFEVRKNGKNLIATANLESSSSAEILFSSKSNKLEVHILNGDNRALEFKEISAWQLNEHILAYLEANNRYTFLSGDRNANLPDYDLKFFTDGVLDSVPETSHLAVTKNSLFKQAKKKENPNYTILIWIAIIGSLVLLSFLCWKIMKDLNTRVQHIDETEN